MALGGALKYVINMPDAHRRINGGQQFQPIPGDFLFSLTQPPAERTHGENLIDYQDRNAPHKWIQFLCPMLKGVEGKGEVSQI